MAITGIITTDMAPTLTWTISTGSGAVGAVFTDPVSKTQTTITVTASGGDAATCTAFIAACAASTAVSAYCTVTQGAGTTATLTYIGTVGLPAAVTASGTGITVTGTGSALGIYASGQQIQVAAAWTSAGVAATTVTGVNLALTPPSGIIEDGSLVMNGQAIPASATTTFNFPAHIPAGQTGTVALTLNYTLICGTTVATATGAPIQIAPPPLVGGIFPNDTN